MHVFMCICQICACNIYLQESGADRHRGMGYVISVQGWDALSHPKYKLVIYVQSKKGKQGKNEILKTSQAFIRDGIYYVCILFNFVKICEQFMSLHAFDSSFIYLNCLTYNQHFSGSEVRSDQTCFHRILDTIPSSPRTIMCRIQTAKMHLSCACRAAEG